MRFKIIYLNENIDIRTIKANALGLVYIGWRVWKQESTNLKFLWDKDKLEFTQISSKNLFVKNDCFLYSDNFFKDALDGIFKIHNIISQKNIKIKMYPKDDNFFLDNFGNISEGIVNGDSLYIHNKSSRKELTVIHEVGHVIDTLLGEGSIPSTNIDNIHSVLGKMNNMFKETTCYKKMKFYIDKNKMSVNNLKDIQLPPEYIDLLKILSLPHEMFSRFYEQYISNNTQNVNIKNQFSIKRDEMSIGYYNDIDLKMLSEEFEKVLTKVGWYD